MTIAPGRARLYHQLRSAHLERAAQLAPATILYGRHRYDFDPTLADRLHLVRARGWRAALYLLRHPVSVLEVNEPLMTGSVRSTAWALLGLRIGRLLGAPATRVVAYAIENLDPRGLPPAERLRHRLAQRLDLGLGRLVWRRLDRIAYGTAASRELYRRALPQSGRRPLSTLVPALPAPAADAEAAADRDRVLFLGAFVPRKGLPLVLQSWPAVRRHCPDARLVVVGQGALQPLVEAAARGDDSIEVVVDPPRARVRELLRTSRVLVLPSQPAPRWREQVGLPLVEGLSYGCTLVTTAETGLAGWLADRGHRVVDADADPATLATALASAFRQPLDPAQVLASLPAEDGRLAADAWLFATGEPEPDRA